MTLLALESVLDKMTLWHHVIEPRVVQFQMDTLDHIQYPSAELKRQRSTERPTMDTPLIGVLSDLHAINGAVYQIAQSLLGDEKMAEYPLPLFDLDVLVQPYLKVLSIHCHSNNDVLGMASRHSQGHADHH